MNIPKENIERLERLFGNNISAFGLYLYLSSIAALDNDGNACVDISIRSLSNELKIEYSKLRRMISKMIDDALLTHQVTHQVTHQMTHLTISNIDICETQKRTNRRTNRRTEQRTNDAQEKEEKHKERKQEKEVPSSSSPCTPIISNPIEKEINKETEKEERTEKQNLSILPKEKEIEFEEVTVEVDPLKQQTQDFYNSLIPFVGQYPKEMVRSFFDYWSEPNQSKTKMRWQMEKTWDTSRRLSFWSRNNRNFNNNTQNGRIDFAEQRKQARYDVYRRSLADTFSSGNPADSIDVFGDGC